MSLRSPVQLNYHRANRLVTAPAEEPVTAAELRAYLIEDATNLPDAEANTLIEEARQYIEDLTGLAFVTQTWRMNIDRWPGRQEAWWDGIRDGAIGALYDIDRDMAIAVPRFPLQSVSDVDVYDEDSNVSAVTIASVFDVDAYSMPGRISLKYGATWPVALRANNAIEITYVAGYGDAADVPAAMKRAIKMLASKMYSERGDGCSAEDAYSASGAKSIIELYRNKRI